MTMSVVRGGHYGGVCPCSAVPTLVRHISKKTALRPVASCSSRPPDVPGAYNVNSSSGCFRPGWFRLGATFFRPDAPGAPWRSLPSNHTSSAKPLPPAAPEAPVRLPPPPEAFRPRILSSQMRPVPSHDTPLPLNLSQTLLYPLLFLPYPADVFLPPSPSFPSAGHPLCILQHPLDVLVLLFSHPLPSTLFSSAERYSVRRMLYRPPDIFPYPLSHCLPDLLVFIHPTYYYDFLAYNRPPATRPPSAKKRVTSGRRNPRPDGLRPPYASRVP